MISIKVDEMVGITELSKSLSGFIDKVKTNTFTKLAIMRNNKPEAVILPIERYEVLEGMAEVIENIEIEKIISQRIPDGEFHGGFDYEAYREKRKSKVNT